MSHGPYQEAIAAARTIDELPKREMYATEAELMKEQVPIGWRDYCAHVLIPLNRCRRENAYMSWTCMNQKHAYEKCQYEDYMWRTRKQQLLRQAAASGASQPAAAATAAAGAAAKH